jgi:hypothetical protein
MRNEKSILVRSSITVQLGLSMSRHPEPFASSLPTAWLRPYYAEVARRAGFANLSPAHQFRALIDRIARQHPDRAAELRDANAATARAILGWLAAVTGERPAARETPLWRVRKGERELRCVAVSLPTGIDLRLFEADDFRRTALCADASALAAGANDWLNRLLQRGWMKIEDATTSAR